jgi:hypothetical protein
MRTYKAFYKARIISIYIRIGKRELTRGHVGTRTPNLRLKRPTLYQLSYVSPPEMDLHHRPPAFQAGALLPELSGTPLIGVVICVHHH